MNKLEEKAIFFIPVGHEFGVPEDNAVQLVYAPLVGRSFLVRSEEAAGMQEKLQALADSGIEKEVKGEPLSVLFAEKSRKMWLDFAIEPEDCLNLTILPNHRCNFNCTYCYSAGGRSGAELKTSQATALAKWALEHCAQKNRRCRILFLGGGEPLLSWELVRNSILSAKAYSTKLGVDLELSASTNGSLLTPYKIEFLRDNDVSLQISFEVLEDIQNLQRGHYDLVHANICVALEAGVNLGLHSVITEANLDRMVEVVQCAHKHYPLLRKLGLEPVVDAEALADEMVAETFYNRFFENYVKAEKLGRQYGIELLTAYSKNTGSVQTHYCAGQIVLTPQGTFSSCEAISSPRETGYDESIFGRLGDSNEIIFDKEAFRRIRPAHPGFLRDKCDSCWARWNCGGGCNYKRRTLRPEVFDAYCRFSRKLMLHALADKLRAEYARSSAGETLDMVVKKLLNN